MRDDVWVIGVLIVLLTAIVLGLYGWYGWRLTKRASRSKAAVLSRLVGQEATLFVQGEVIVAPHRCIILRLEDDLVVVREVTNAMADLLGVSRPGWPLERVLALDGIREIRQGDQCCGRW